MGSLNNAMFSEIVAQSARGFLVVDAARHDTEIIYANPAYERASGYTLQELVGSSWLDYAAADAESDDVLALRHSLAGAESVELRLPFLRKDGEIWSSQFRLTPLSDSTEGRRLMLCEHLGDDERARADGAEVLQRLLGCARRKLATLDRTDALTGLMSKNEFRIVLRRELAIARRHGHSVHLMLFSIPELDVYRQTFGDSAADSCLRMIAAQIAGTFRRASDLSARIDDATLVVAISRQDDEQASGLVEQVERKARSLGLHNPRGRQGRYVLVHGAVVAADPSTDDVDSLLRRCADALEDGSHLAATRSASVA